MQDKRRGEVVEVAGPVVRPPQIPPEPDAPRQADETPDEHGFQAVPASQPETGTGIEQLSSERLSLRHIAKAPFLPPLAPAHFSGARRFVLPGISGADTRQNQENPGQPVRDANRREVLVRIRVISSV